ncbi:hypothetical protein CCC_01909 [Paramagnetospirillum magnetotacticum MS-1]|uniref:Uncharacterized protein n=2 Tax=Paramagnetospirillum magnetotacticum TaxID=188 RepID=A0A0C2Z0R1_PARME|nr:hypothetical protein CCC_01909 [Paramagnetospirillum magnetotacticum MS-1]
MPELKQVPAKSAYDRVIGSIYLVQRAFRVFRDGREQFRHLLVDADGKVVPDDTTPLSCGRSLEQVVAMVVRTTARRYFRQHLAPPDDAETSDDKGSLLERIGLKASRPTAQFTPKQSSQADELYDTIKEYLLYEWQVPLVPTYATLTVERARSLGGRLLECNSPGKLALLLGLPLPVEIGGAQMPESEAASAAALAARPAVKLVPAGIAVSSPPAPVRPTGQSLIALIVTPDGKRLRGSSFSDTLLSPEVRAVLKNDGLTLHLTSILGAAGAVAAKALVGGLGLGMEQLAVLLLGSRELVGDSVFLRLFGPSAEPAVLERFVQRARSAGIGPSTTLPEVIDFVTSVFTRAVEPAGR